MTLDRVRCFSGSDECELRQLVINHWKARQQSTWRLGDIKEARLRRSLWGFVGPVLYFAALLAM